MHTTYKTLSALIMSFGMYSNLHAETVSIEMTPEVCLKDLEYTAHLILENDAGIIAKRWTTYPEQIQQIFNQQKEKLQGVKTVVECQKIIRPFMKSIRNGHLGISIHPDAQAAQQQSSDTQVPIEVITENKAERVTTKKLSDSTTLLTILSFDYALYEKIQQVVSSNQDNLLKAPYLIIDLRNNDGGSDQTAEVLYKILGEAKYWNTSPQIYASSTNIDGWEAYKSFLTDEDSLTHLNKTIKKMREQQNQWVSMSSYKESQEVVTSKDILATPQKVVILIDKNCGSSCEQFVLTAQQNPRVVTMGRPTYGALDASNVMEKTSPSKQLQIYYASTYIHRPAGKEIDGVGIPPAIKLPKPQNQAEYSAEIQLAQRYLEQGL
ncbi:MULTISPECIES: S41 family peptidase [unclassified Acinetobacter]|uniref:S41 family peptidase n=1 Tax=unclassified Acinetobacter TaxID=196816 RepID=UPI0015D3DB7D|nr:MULTISPECIES: S41 family peptidase [unclassified Acinetobacter]